MQLPRFIMQEPNLVEKPWGGRWILRFKGLEGDGRRVGESWEFSTHPARPSYVIIKGKRISLLELLRLNGEEILGKRSESLPILVKLLDINSKISIQVHPSDRVAKFFGESENGKNEGWLILDHGRVYIGFQEDLKPSDLLPDPSIEEKMNQFDAEFLDTFKIPAGTIHFAENARILEISSNSNITYRIYDFENRSIQFEKAIKALKFKKSLPDEIKSEKGKISMREFEAEVIPLHGTVEIEMHGFNIVLAIKGSAVLESGGEVVELKKGHSCLVPAITKEYALEGDKALVCRIYSPN